VIPVNRRRETSDFPLKSHAYWLTEPAMIRQTPRATSFLWLLFCLAAGACAPAPDTDRLAAQWVLKTGGYVQLDCQGHSVRIEPAQKLPKSAFSVRSIGWDIYPGDRNTNVSDADLQRLTELADLRELDLWSAQITDEGAKLLSRLANLRRLQLSQTQISDAGLEQLRSLTHLTELGLIETRVTPAGIRRFQRERPECKLVFQASTGSGP
jgi:hypothetical protein